MKTAPVPPAAARPISSRAARLFAAVLAGFACVANAAVVADSFTLADGTLLHGSVVNGAPTWTADARVVLANGVVTTNSNGHAEFKLPVPNKDGGRLVLKADLRVGEGTEWAGLFLGAEQGSAFDNVNNPLLVTLRGTGYVQLLKNGRSSLLYSSPHVVAGFNRSKFHTLELHYDADAGKADVFVDGNKINTNPISVGPLNNARINSAGLRFNGTGVVGGSPAADSFSYNADGREFFDAFASPDGPLNGIALNGAPAWRVKAGTSLAPLVAASGAVTTNADGSAEFTLATSTQAGGVHVLKADLRVGENAEWAGLFFGAAPQSGYTDPNNPLMLILRGNGYVQLFKNGVSPPVVYTSSQTVANFDRAKFHTLELRYDRDAGKADVLVDGNKLNTNPITVGALNNAHIGAVGVRFQGAKNGKPAADNVSYAAGGREAVICYLSWHSPIGKLNGTTQWAANGYRHQLAEESDGIMNYPLPPPIDDFPTQAPGVGGTEFYRLQREAAAITQHQMIEAGFDALLFDMLPMPDYDPESPLTEFNSPLAHFKTFLVWLEEAEQTGIKVGLMPDIANQSGDYPQRRNPTVSEWSRVLAGALDQTPDSSALWKIDGRPVLAHFGTDSFYGSTAPDPSAPKPEGGWAQILSALRDAGKVFHFIADIRPHAQVATWNGIADSAWLFTPAAPAGALPDMQRVIAGHLSIPLMWTVSPGYYRGGGAYTQPGFARIHDTYLEAMRSGARRICVLTWNDFEEDTDIVPSDNKGHALLDVFSYYNQWFKTGSQPRPTEDRVVLAYPRRIPSAVVTNPPAYGRLGNNLVSIPGGWPSPAYRPKVFYWAWVQSPGDLSVEGVGTVHFPQAGLWYGELGLASNGSVRASFRGESLEFPAIVATTTEQARSGEGGLEYRYVNVTAQP